MGRLARVVAMVAALCLVPLSPSAAAPAAPRPPSASEMKDAQKRANAAAGRLARAQAAMANAEREIAELESHTASTRRIVDRLESQVRELAVAQYVQGNVVSTWVGDGDPGEAARGRAMLRYVSLGRTDSVEGYQVARLDLEQSQVALAERLAAQKAVVGGLRKEEAKVTAELNRLAAAQRAYEAKLAADRAAAAKAAASARRASRSAAPAPAAGAPAVIGSGAWICPVQGPRAFTNSWGAPRSGGRSHQGVDLMSARGTPVVANVAGTVKGHSSRLGGISYYLNGDDGHTYFGTHLDRLSGASGRVAAGTVIGYVGSSGNASASGPHLHFEIHPNGGRAVNPYPTVARYC